MRIELLNNKISREFSNNYKQIYVQKSHNLSSELEINGSEHALVASSPGNGVPCPRDLESMYQRMRILHCALAGLLLLDN